MPNNTTRKCYLKRSNATQKLAAERRKLSEDVLALNEKAHQVLLDTMHGQFKKAKKMLKDVPKNSPLRKIIDIEQFAKLLSSGYLMNQQFKHLPPMSEAQEKELIERLKLSLEKTKESIKKISKNKTMNRVSYKNPYPFKATAMPNLYVGTSECAWESENVEKLYAQRQKAIKEFLAILNKNNKILDSVRKGKNAHVFLMLEKNMEMLRDLPPGPTNASEQERIDYLHNGSTTIKNMFDMINMMMKEMEKIFKDMKKNAIKEHLAKK